MEVLVREVLETSRQVEYFNTDGLRTLTGLDEKLWDFAILKELLDNALDAINEITNKRVSVRYENDKLTIYDSGSGIPEQVLDTIFDFEKYVSSKRFFKTPTRGFQGNALKTVIAICYLNHYKLNFSMRGKLISYKLNESKIKAGICEFKKQKKEVKKRRSGVIIKGIKLDKYKILDTIWTYHLCNPDVTFKLNNRVFKSVTDPIKRTEKTFIHWYDFSAFDQLVQAVSHKDQNRTTRDFCLIFSGAQRLIFDDCPRVLSDVAKSKKSKRRLYKELTDSLTKPRPELLKKNISGKESFFKIYGNSEVNKYKLLCGEYQLNEATVPFVLEGFLLYSKDQDSQTKIITAVNNSIPYNDCPFNFTSADYETAIHFCKKEYSADSLDSLLDMTGFTSESSGLFLFLNFISPHIEFTDKSKTQIISNKFGESLLKLTEYLCKDTIKEIEKIRKQRRAFDRRSAMTPTKKDSKTELMKRHFWEGYDLASGGYLTTVRQIFYSVRNIINLKYGRELSQSDYNGTFTQKIVTMMINEHPEYENKILFDRRGYFYNPLDDTELPLGTEDVVKFTNKQVLNRIIKDSVLKYSIPDNLKFNHVLFVEKGGFNIILKQSGLLDELNLGIMSTAGFGTRACKRLIKYFLENNIKVYALTDCDIAGYLMADKFRRGSDTFKESLDIERIGLTVEDVDRLNKRDTAEEVSYRRGYTHSLDILTKKEFNFLVIDQYRSEFKRVELNNLTTPELIDFIKSKIQYEPIKPSVAQLQNYIEIEEREIIKEALIRANKNKLKVNIDNQTIAKKIYDRINASEHWLKTMDDAVNDYIEKEIVKMKNQIIKRA